MHKVPCGPTVFFDCDDTLLMWDRDFEDKRCVVVECRDYQDRLLPNDHNINLLKNLAKRGHAIVVWSGGGADWAEAVVKALHLEKYVSVVTGKPTYYVDDVKDPSKWMGKYSYHDADGVRHGHHGIPEEDQ